MMTKKVLNKKSVVGIIAVVILGIGIGSITGKTVEAETMEVSKESFVDTITEDGAVLPTGDFKVYAETQGLVKSIHKSEGDKLEKGEVIATVDASTLKLELEGLKGQLLSLEGSKQMASEVVKKSDIVAQQSVVESAKVHFEQTKKDEKRSKQLLDAGAVSKTDYEKVQVAMLEAENTYKGQVSNLATLESSNRPQKGTTDFHEGQIRQLQAEIDILEDQIRKSILRAGTSGVLAEFSLEEGDRVEAMQKVASIISVDQVEIEVLVLAEEAYNLIVDQQVVISRERNGQNESIIGRIKSIAPSAVETMSTLGIKEKRVKIIVGSDEKMTPALIPGSDVDVEIIIHQSTEAIVIPKTAVFYSDQGDAVWMVKDNRIHLQLIDKGYESNRSIETLAGLMPGDRIVKYYDTVGLSMGSRIK